MPLNCAGFDSLIPNVTTFRVRLNPNVSPNPEPLINEPACNSNNIVTTGSIEYWQIFPLTDAGTGVGFDISFNHLPDGCCGCIPILI